MPKKPKPKTELPYFAKRAREALDRYERLHDEYAALSPEARIVADQAAEQELRQTLRNLVGHVVQTPWIQPVQPWQYPYWTSTVGTTSSSNLSSGSTGNVISMKA